MTRKQPTPSTAAATTTSSKRQKLTTNKPTTKPTAIKKSATTATHSRPSTPSSSTTTDDISDFIYFRQPTDNARFQTLAAATSDAEDGMSDGEDGEYIEVEDKVKPASQVAKQQQPQPQTTTQANTKASQPLKQPIKPMFSIEDSASESSSSDNEPEAEKTCDTTHVDTPQDEEMKVSFADVKQQSATAAAPPTTTQSQSLSELQQNPSIQATTSESSITPFNTSASNPLRQPSQVSPAASNVMQARTRNNKQKLIIVLLKSSLATIKTKKGMSVLVRACLHSTAAMGY